MTDFQMENTAILSVTVRLIVRKPRAATQRDPVEADFPKISREHHLKSLQESLTRSEISAQELKRRKTPSTVTI